MPFETLFLLWPGLFDSYYGNRGFQSRVICKPVAKDNSKGLLDGYFHLLAYRNAVAITADSRREAERLIHEVRRLEGMRGLAGRQCQ
ncbi:MAG TPA: hypothetical protein VKV17_18965 [Bryobacteraceae bacterium]|nr:hypothetical protein [Bryobacteraceae bacterium]